MSLRLSSRIVPAASVLLGLMLSGSAYAGGWEDYAAAFPAFPCQDGWMACIVGGDTLTPDTVKAGGVPTPADLRLSWDLKPTAGFSPFGSLSAYTGAAPAVADAGGEAEAEPEAEGGGEAEAEPEPEAGGGEEPVAASGGSSSGGGGGSSSGGGGSSSGGGGSSSSGGSSGGGGAVAVSGGGGGGGGAVKPKEGGGAAPAGGESGGVKPKEGGATAPVAAGGATAKVDPPAGGAVAPAGGGAAVPAAADNSCDNITKLEPQAMLGKLSDGQISCLEGSYSSAAKQTDKDKVSRVLMANAYSKGDTKKWEELVKRHLSEVDQSDADLCYKYALQLSKGGAGRANGAIKWADVALENRSVWTGDTYVSRVSGLYKIRAAASQSLWKSAEEEYTKAPSEEQKKKSEDARNKTKGFAREWYEYLKSAGKDTTTALQLCVQAAGTKEYCEGG